MIEINNRVILILIGFFLGVILTIIIIIYLQMTNPLRIEKKGHYLVKSKKIRREIIKIPIKTPFKEIYGDNYRDMIKAKGLSKNFKENDEYLYGEIYTSINTPKEKSPLLIFCHGLGGYHNDLNFEQLCTSLALGGYTILAYDHRGHGKSTAYAFSKNEGLLIFKYIYHDIEDVINYAMKLPNIDKERIGLIGFSLGAGVVMTKPLNDPRIKLIIAGCGMNSLKDVYQHLKNSRIFSMGWLFYKFMNMKIKIKTEDLEKYKDIFE
ncbi:MAG: alpha/beta hydrolase, partial [Promethearchaeota archaeon]